MDVAEHAESESASKGKQDASSHIELSFSGGGIRAAAFSLGVYMYIKDAGFAGSVRQISSVSGGSLTNAILSRLWTDGELPSDAGICNFIAKLANGGLPLERLAKGLRRTAKLSVVIAIALFALLSTGAFIIGGFALGAPTSLAIVIGAIAMLLAVLLLFCVELVFIQWLSIKLINGNLNAWFRAVTDPTAESDGKSLFTNRFRNPLRALEVLGNPAVVFNYAAPFRLADSTSPVSHVYTSTDLTQGEHIHLSRAWLLSEAYGVNSVGDVYLDEAVRASAAFPGGLPPVRLNVNNVFSSRGPLTGHGKYLTLVDGGVRDNLGHVFNTYITNSHLRESSPLTKYGSIAKVVCVDASAPKGIEDLAQNTLSHFPIIRRIPQIVTFPRVIGVMNQSNSEARSAAIDSVLRREGIGFVVSIQSNPIGSCKRVIANSEVVNDIMGNRPPRREDPYDAHRCRAMAALRELVNAEESAEATWNTDVVANSTTPTTLDGLGDERIARLVRHGYVQAMIESHIVEGWPLQPKKVWSISRFTAQSGQSG